MSRTVALGGLARENPGMGRWAILHGYRGSIAHGTFVPSSDPLSIDDKDTMAICVPPKDHYMGLSEFGSRGTQEIVRDEWDVVVYEARKAMRLLAKGNPNVLALLWLPEHLWIKRTPAGRMLLNHRSVFVGKHVYQAFAGYASGQLAKMERGVYKGYMGDKRRALVEQFGYDTKNASHCIRLLRQGIEFLATGEMVVERPDAAQLLAIKRGEWPIEKVKQEAEMLFGQAREALARSDLPANPDPALVNALCVQIVETAWETR
jgi:predicted nucleotidyltransferase